MCVCNKLERSLFSLFQFILPIVLWKSATSKSRFLIIYCVPTAWELNTRPPCAKQHSTLGKNTRKNYAGRISWCKEIFHSRYGKSRFCDWLQIHPEVIQKLKKDFAERLYESTIRRLTRARQIISLRHHCVTARFQTRNFPHTRLIYQLFALIKFARVS